MHFMNTFFEGAFRRMNLFRCFSRTAFHIKLPEVVGFYHVNNAAKSWRCLAEVKNK